MNPAGKPGKRRRLVQCPECEQGVPVRKGERQVYERHLVHGELCPGTGVELPMAQQTRKQVPVAAKVGKPTDTKNAERRAREAVRKSERTEREARDAAYRAEYGSKSSVRNVTDGAPTLGKGHR